MKTLFQNILKALLKSAAKMIIARHKPIIIGVTGSVGKTSTTQAIAHVLSGTFDVRVTQGNYNNEYGLPLTVIGATSGGSSVGGWITVFITWVRVMAGSTYPSILVLEYGIDQPGDMEYLVSIARPQIALITQIDNAHREFFQSMNHIAQQKGILVESIMPRPGAELSKKLTPSPCAALINLDDKYATKFERLTKKAVYTFGREEGADYRASHIALANDNASSGLTFKLGVGDRSLPVRLPHIVGEHNVSSVLAAIGVAQILKINFHDITTLLSDYRMPVGRMRLLQGRDDTLLIDDTYNAASILAVSGAIQTLAKFKPHRTVAILGDMLELGEAQEKAHRKIGQILIAQKIDLVIVVGSRMETTSTTLQKSGYHLGENLFHVDTPAEATQVIEGIKQSGDVILVKGSQGMRMEKVSATLLAKHLDADVELCRQTKAWKNKPFLAP